MLVFECPFCKATLQAAPERGADAIVCPGCRCAASMAPDSAQPGVRRVRDDDDDDDDRPRPKKTSSSGAGAAAAGAGIGIGMILLIVGGIAGCCLCLPAILVGVSIPVVQKVREAAANTQAMNNARVISLALHSHNDRHGSLPSPKMQPQGPQNIPVELSWRVSILPFMNQQGLFNEIDKTQAWDSPRNNSFVSRMPMTFGQPLNPETSQTKFQYFTGPNTVFPDALTRAGLPRDFTDGTSNTFLFAEAATPVPWSRPADMVIGNGPLPLPEGKFIAAMADGTARIVNRRSASDDVLRQIINPKDNKIGPPGWGE